MAGGGYGEGVRKPKLSLSPDRARGDGLQQPRHARVSVT